MNYTIENDVLKVEISDLGAELMSVKSKKTGFEFLWQGNPEFWSGRAYVLFPICGRLTEGKYTYKGNTYEMNLHGFSRKTVHKVVNKEKDKITFELTENENTLKMYPFAFRFNIIYSLSGNSLKTEMKILNRDEKVLPCSVGGHPGFNVPLENGLNFSDHYLEFSRAQKVKQQIFSETCYYTGKLKDFELENDKILRLNHNLFDNDAIFLSNMADTITLKSDKTSRKVTIHFNDMTHLGLWHKPKSEAPFICIEPWHGTAAFDGVIDDFESKNEFMYLKPNESYDTFFTISIDE